MIVLDTNVVSAVMRPQGHEAAVAWFGHQSPRDLRTTAITVAEIQYGIARLPQSRRQRDLADDAAKVWALFRGFVLPFDEEAAQQYAWLLARRERAGRPIQRLDAQIAAICLARSATLATRNVKDFDDLGLDVVDPWA